MEKLLLWMGFPAERLFIHAEMVLQQITMYGMGPLMGGDQTAGEIPGSLDRAVFKNEDAVPFHRRFPFRRDPHDRRPLDLTAQKIGQVKIGDLDIAANQRLLLLMA